MTICHAIGQANPPYHRIHVSKKAEEAHDHHQHDEDVLLGRDDTNTKQCPTTPVPPGRNHKVTICHPLPDGAYDRIHVTENSDEHNAHKGHAQDIIARDDDDDDDCPTPDDGEDDGNENCAASSTSGDSAAVQRGLVNVGNVDVDAPNALANVLCQPEILDYLTLSVLGHSTGPSFFGTGLLGGGPGGALTNLLDADASLLAKLAVIL